MKNFDCIIFDVDGTLTSTNNLIFSSFKFIAKKYLNKLISDEEIIANFGPPENVILKKWCPEKFEEAKTDYFNYYANNHDIASLHKGMDEILVLIKERGALAAVDTGKSSEATRITLGKFDILKYFNMVITGDDVEKPKPSGEGILKIVDALKLNKERTLMVGDSPVDVQAAKEAGVKMAAVLWDSYAADEVKTMKYDFLFNDSDELKNFLKENV